MPGGPDSVYFSTTPTSYQPPLRCEPQHGLAAAQAAAAFSSRFATVPTAQRADLRSGTDLLTSLFSFDKNKRVAKLVERGEYKKAAELLARQKDYLGAGRLALQGNDPKSAANHFFCAMVGPSDDLSNVKPLQVGGLLVAAGNLPEALAMFETARAFDRAASVAAKLKDPRRAALNYERGRQYEVAARYYERAKDYENAARVLAAEARESGPVDVAEVRREDPRSPNPAFEKRRDLDLRRARLLIRAGKKKDAGDILRAWPARTAQEAEMVAEINGPSAGVDSFLRLEMPQAALRLLEQQADPDRRQLAAVQRHCGNLKAAAAIYASLGDDHATAQVLEEDGNFGSAAKRWEKLQRYDQAAECFRKAKRPKDSARCYAAAGRFRAASTHYLEAGETDLAARCLSEREDLLGAARIYAQAGSMERAAELLRQVDVSAPDYADATLLLVPHLVESTLQADEALRRINLVPSQRRDAKREPDWLYWEARCLQALARPAEALAAYRRLLIPRSEHRDASKRLNELEHELAVSNLTHQVTTGRTLDPRPAPTEGEPASKSGEHSDSFSTTSFERLLAESRRYREGLDGALHEEIAPEAPSPKSDGPGRIVLGQVFADRYEIEAQLGQGGMGQVVRAKDLLLGEPVAIKTVLEGAGAEYIDRLIREVQICRKIAHPNVVRVFDAGRLDNGVFVTMEFIDGIELSEWLVGNPKPSLDRVADIAGQIANGLAAAHELGVVHRDLKPGNVMLEGADGDTLRVKIVDFGIARMHGADATITQAGMVVGSPLYMSPEQLSGRAADGRADLYALGNLIYRLLAGFEPFKAKELSAILYGHLHTEPQPLDRVRADLPSGWQELVTALLAKEPTNRPQSAQDVAAQIGALATASA